MIGTDATIGTEPDTIPAELKALDQWVSWRVELRDDKPAKVPLNPLMVSANASTTDPATWDTFDQAVEHYEDNHTAGIGFVFTAADPYCGVDLDDCRDPETGEIAPWAQKIIDGLKSYTEISPSGSGVKIIVKATKPGSRCRTAYGDGEIEVYDRARYFALTGHRVEGTPATIEERQDALDELYASTFGEPTGEAASNGTIEFCGGDLVLSPEAERPPKVQTLIDRNARVDSLVRTPVCGTAWG